MPEMSVHDLQSLLGSAVRIEKLRPAEVEAISNLIVHWRQQLPLIIMPVVLAAVEALPEASQVNSAADSADNADNMIAGTGATA
jgi:hypothetical protein